MERIIGREGSGPGEFRAPYDARFLADGRIAALDPEASRVSFFDGTGAFLRSFVPSGQDARLILPDGTDGLLIAGLADVDSGGRLLVRYDLDGNRRGAQVNADPLLFDIDLVVSQPWLARAADGSVVAGLTVTPAVHRVSADGSHQCAALAPSAWRQLEAPEPGDRQSLASRRAWIEGASLVDGGAVLRDGRLALVYTVPGEEPVFRLALYRSDLRPLIDLVGVPGRLAGSDADDLFFVRSEDAEQTTLERYRALTAAPASPGSGGG